MYRVIDCMTSSTTPINYSCWVLGMCLNLLPFTGNKGFSGFSRKINQQINKIMKFNNSLFNDLWNIRKSMASILKSPKMLMEMYVHFNLSVKFQKTLHITMLDVQYLYFRKTFSKTLFRSNFFQKLKKLTT